MTTTAVKTLGDEKVEALRGSVRGDVLALGSDGYEASRRIWNAMHDRHPAVVLRPTGVADVRAGIAFARELDLPLSIKGGGHNIAGLAVADGAVMLDMSRMRAVLVDKRAQVARAQAGCLLGDVDRETQVHGLAAVLGFVSETGIAGLTLGGGVGYLSRRFGWTVDNLREVELVTAGGGVLPPSRDSNPDLFWAVSGGGGNFGVVTSFTYDLKEVGPDIVGGPIAWHGSDALEVLDFLRSFADDAPRELTCVGGVRLAPPAPWLPSEVHGKPIVMVIACYSGDPEEGEKVVAPLKAFGDPVGGALQRRPYTQMQSLLDATQPKGRRYYWKSEYVSALEDGLIETIVGGLGTISSPHSAILLFQLGGAVRERDASVNAAGNREAGWVVNVAGSWEQTSDDEKNKDWARTVHSDCLPYSSGLYVNFLNDDDDEARVAAAYGANFERLAKIKSEYDPDNFFRLNKNVRPR